MTKRLFLDLFSSCFVHEVEQYLKSKTLVFKVCLVLGNAQGHLQVLGLDHPNIHVDYGLRTPPHSCSCTTSKSSYTRCLFCNILDASENEAFVSVGEYWKSRV